MKRAVFVAVLVFAFAVVAQHVIGTLFVLSASDESAFPTPVRGGLVYGNDSGHPYLADATRWNGLSFNSAGTTAQRPTNPVVGQVYFDTNLLRPVFWNGTAWYATGADFWLAPPGGAGMGTGPCAGTGVATAAGLPIVWNRDGGAFCTKYNQFSGIVTGDVVFVAADTPRTTTGGTDGGLGLLFEPNGRNMLAQSQLPNVAPWTTQTGGGASLNFFGDAGLNVAGVAGATRIDFSAVSIVGNQLAQIYQDLSITNGTTYTFSGYFLGLDGGSTEYLWLNDQLVNSPASACNYTTGTWTRCFGAFTSTNTTATGRFHFGNNRFGLLTSANTSATSVMVSKLQVEISTGPTSPIDTGASAVNRGADFATYVQPLTQFGSLACAAASIEPTTSNVIMGDILSMDDAGIPLYVNTTVRMYDGTVVVGLDAGFVSGTIKRYRSTWDGGTQLLQNLTDGTSQTGAFDGTMGTTGPLRVGGGLIGQGPYILKNLQLSHNFSQCQ